MTRVDLLRGRARADDEPSNASAPQLRWIAMGANPKGIIAVGGAAEGILAVGVNAIGAVAIGVNAMGTFAAAGVNAVAPLAVSGVNSVAVFGASLVNVIGGFGWAPVNDFVHPILGWVLLVISVVVSFRLGGRWRKPELPPRVELSELQSGRATRGWTEVALLGTERRAVVVGTTDEQVTLTAPSKVVQYATELCDEKTRQVLAHVEVRFETDAARPGEYRAPAETTAVLHADELRRLPARPLRPCDARELRWVLSKSLWLSAGLSAGLMIALSLL